MRRRQLLSAMTAGLTGCTGSGTRSPTATETGDHQFTVPPDYVTATDEPAATIPIEGVDSDRVVLIGETFETPDGYAITVEFLFRTESVRYGLFPYLSPPTPTPNVYQPSEGVLLFVSFSHRNTGSRGVDKARVDDLAVVASGERYPFLEHLPDGPPVTSLQSKDVGYVSPGFTTRSLPINTVGGATFVSVVPHRPIYGYAVEWAPSERGLEPVYWYSTREMAEQ